MKIGWAISFLTSGALATVVVLAQRSCDSSWDVDADRRLTSNQKVVPWSEVPEEVSRLREMVQPGDTILRIVTKTELPYLNFFELSWSRVEIVRRSGDRLVYRDGLIRYWLSLMGISLVPLSVWGIIVLLTLCWPSPRR